MENDSRFYRIVYEYYEARILFGVCACGEKLPSIPKICAMFGMAPATVRMALKVLEKDRYIQMDARKAARVTYNSSRQGAGGRGPIFPAPKGGDHGSDPVRAAAV